MPAHSRPRPRSTCRTRSTVDPWSAATGAMAPNAAMLHAVNVPARPDTNAKSTPAPTPAIGVLAASWPSRVSATVPPIVLSTNSADQTTVSRKPTSALRPTTSQGRRGRSRGAERKCWVLVDMPTSGWVDRIRGCASAAGR